MFKRTKTSEISFFTFVLFISAFCFFLDLICSMVIGVTTMGDGTSTEIHKLPFSVAIYNQLTFYSIWVLFINVFYAIYRIMLNDRKYIYGTKMQEGHWSDLLIILINMVSFSLYTPTLIASVVLQKGDLIAGAALDYQIVKSALEHVIMPPTITIYLLVFARFQIDFKDFVSKRSWYAPLGVGIYGIYVISLFGLSESFTFDEYMIRFPYMFIAPDKMTYFGTAGFALLAVVAHFGASVGVAWAFNKTVSRNVLIFNKKFNINTEEEKIEA
ncbi:hypothetical protein [Spiroplasma endosymbiont of Othius punctulatus]|uniref:hypothetical protein n=1 Tax=Spiroplasma endosymbiont of Othius punctulatus TaxID=3066289 RepID=UPI0030D32D6A